MPRLSEDLTEIKPEQLALYLRQKGWTERQLSRDVFLVLREPTQRDDRVEVFIPKNPSLRDYKQRLLEAAETVAALESRTLDGLVDAVRAIDQDIFRVRIATVSSDESTLPLRVAADLVRALRDVISAAATTERNPRRFFERTTKEGVTLVERCRFGQTFHGSFGVTIHSPVPIRAQLELPTSTPQSPFERRVMERVFRGLKIAADAVGSGNFDGLVASYERGLNANMCERLAEISRIVDGRYVGYSIRWSDQWVAADDLRDLSEVRFGADDAKVLDDAARSMRAVETSAPVTIVGRITALRSEADPTETAEIEDEMEDESDRVITIRLQSPHNEISRVSLVLSASEYAAACDAHKRGLAVSVSGTLEKIGRRWWLNNPSALAVVTI